MLTTEWPTSIVDNNGSAMKICILGDTIIQDAFTELDDKPMEKKAIQVINLSRIRNLGQCQLLYASGLEKNKTTQLLSKISKLPVLTIGEDSDFLTSGAWLTWKRMTVKSTFRLIYMQSRKGSCKSVPGY
jgi:hypothetical protein